MFSERKIETRVRQKSDFSEEDVQWADAVISAGGGVECVLTKKRWRNKTNRQTGLCICSGERQTVVHTMNADNRTLAVHFGDSACIHRGW